MLAKVSVGYACDLGVHRATSGRLICYIRSNFAFS